MFAHSRQAVIQYFYIPNLQQIHIKVNRQPVILAREGEGQISSLAGITSVNLLEAMMSPC